MKTLRTIAIALFATTATLAQEKQQDSTSIETLEEYSWMDCYEMLNGLMELDIKELKDKEKNGEGCQCMKKTNLVILEWYTYIFAFLLVIGYMYVCNYYMKGPEYKKILNDYLGR